MLNATPLKIEDGETTRFVTSMTKLADVVETDGHILPANTPERIAIGFFSGP
jgi:hypothetical protein